MNKNELLISLGFSEQYLEHLNDATLRYHGDFESLPNPVKVTSNYVTDMVIVKNLSDSSDLIIKK